MNNEQKAEIDQKVYEDRFSLLRQDIDQIDKEILELLMKRAFIVLEVAEIKKALSLEIFDAQREQAILERLKVTLNEKIEEPQVAEALLKVFESMLIASKDIQRNHLGLTK